jgi:hypothetical protein
VKVALSSKVPTSKQQAGTATGARDDALVATANGALVVWNGEDRRLGDLVASLDRHIPDDVWVIAP